MKKVLFVLAFVAVYGVSMAMTSNSQVVSIGDKVTVVADGNDKVEKEEEKKTAKAKADAKTKNVAKEACSGSKEKAACCSDDKAAKKSECSTSCAGEKSAKKSDCSSSCSGK